MENNQVVKQQPSGLKPWQQALVKAEGKFLAISGKESETKIEMGFAAMLIESNDNLRGCDPASILNSVINVARTGITLNPILKLCHLVPRGKKCVLDFSYIGLIKILKDNNCIKDIQAIIVYGDEKFEESVVSIQKPIHEKKYANSEEEQKKREKKGVYCMVLLPDNTIIYTQFTPAWEILKAKAVSPAANSSYSPWQTWPEEMWKKTKIKKDFKTLISGHPGDKILAALQVESENNDPDYSNQNNQQKESVTSKTLKDIFGSDDAEDAVIVEDEKSSIEQSDSSLTPNQSFTDQMNSDADIQKARQVSKGKPKKQGGDDAPDQSVLDAINNNQTGLGL